jgi:hypothetical protein
MTVNSLKETIDADLLIFLYKINNRFDSVGRGHQLRFSIGYYFVLLEALNSLTSFSWTAFNSLTNST